MRRSIVLTDSYQSISVPCLLILPLVGDEKENDLILWRQLGWIAHDSRHFLKLFFNYSNIRSLSLSQHSVLFLKQPSTQLQTFAVLSLNFVIPKSTPSFSAWYFNNFGKIGLLPNGLMHTGTEVSRTFFVQT